MRDDAHGAPEAADGGDATERAILPALPRTEPSTGLRTGRTAQPSRDGGTVYVVGFWKRLGAGLIDLAIVTPLAMLLTWIAGAIGGVHLPPSGSRNFDYWLDLLLGTEPALLMAIGLFTAVGMIYLLVFHITTARTMGMRILGMKVIDAYGDPPTNARCVVRTLGYLASGATMFLGFLWIGFDREKRGLHDWLAGTYVVRG